MMTKCSWKFFLVFLLGAFFAVYSSSAMAATTQDDLLGGKILSTEEKKKLDEEIEALEKDVAPLKQAMDQAYEDYKKAKNAAQGLFNYKDFWFDSWVVQFGRTVSPLHDNSFETYIAHFEQELEKSMLEGDSEQSQQWNNAIQAAKKYLKAYEDWNEKASSLLDKQNIRDHGENVLVYYDEEKQISVYYVIDEDGNYESIEGVTKGCMPLPAKLAEGRNCIFCPLFARIFSSVQLMATSSFGKLAQSLANVMLVGFALWIAFSLLSKVSSFTKMDAPKYITELLTQIFKVLVAYLLLRDANAIYVYALGPLLKGGMEFGMIMLSSGESFMLRNCTAASVSESMPSDGLLPLYLYTQLDCFIRAIQYELAMPQAIGSSLMCVSIHTAGSDPTGVLKHITSYRFPDISMLFEGLIIWAFAWLLSLAFAFYLVDATVRLGIVGALMPFLIACWPFKVTSKYTNQGFTMFMNTFFVYVFMGLVITINIQLMGVALTGGKGGLEAIEAALNGNQVSVLKDLLDIGFGGFLILIASCIFGFKICGQASELAGSMAGGGGGSSIAPEIGGMGYNVAKAATLGTGKAIGNGAKFVGKVGEASGINEKLRKTRDNAVNKLIKQPLAKIFSLGRSSPNASQRMQPSQAPKPQTSPSAGGNGGTPVTPDQTRQADNVVNAAPRPETTPQTASDTSRATTTQQNQRQAQTGGSSGRTASTQANGSTSTQNTQNVLTPEQQREQHIDQFNRSHAATLDLDRSSALYRQISDQCGKATTNRDMAAQKARSFEAQAKEEMDKAKSLREKAQKMVDGAEKDALMQQANTSDKNANDFKAKATEERNKEKENDAIVRETLKKMDDMKQERLKTMSNEDVDKIMKQTYGNNYRADQSANRNGWSFN